MGMKAMRRYLALSLLCGLMPVLQGQADIRFEEVFSINPLSHNNVTCIHQDRQGFLWIGTFNGLNKYDGYSFRVYRFNDLEGNSAGTNRVSSIQEDRSGRLWIETYDGNYLYLNPLTEQIQSIPLETGSLQSRFTDYYESESGMVCLSTEGAGVYFIDCCSLEEEPVITHIRNREGEEPLLTSNSVNFVIQDRNGYFWIGTDQGLSRVHEEDLDKENPRILKYYSQPYSAAVEFGGKLWFANRERGLTWYDPANEHFAGLDDYPEVSSLATSEITVLKAFRRELWTGTAEGKLMHYDTETDSFRVAILDDPRSGKRIDEIHCDIHGQVWLLTEEAGITRYDPERGRFRYYRLAPENSRELIDDERTKFFEDSDNKLWLAGQSIGVQLYDRERDRFTVYINDPGDPRSLPSNVVEYIMEDREKNIWIGTNWFGKGLCRMISVDPAFTYVVPVRESGNKMQNLVRAVYTDSEGYVWAGTKSGQVYIYNPELEPVHVIQAGRQSKYSGYNVYSISEDESGYIWLCTKGAGIYISDQSLRDIAPRYDELSFTNIRHRTDDPNSLSSNNVYDVEIDETGRIWVATFGGGLNLVERTGEGGWKFHRYHTGNSDLSSDNLRDLHLDRNGRLWIASTYGVNYLDIYNKEYTGTPVIGHIVAGKDGEEGLSYNDIIMILEDSDGHLWLASAGGGVNEILNPEADEFQIRYYSVRDGLKDDYILSLAEDMYGFIWMGTASGLSRYNPVNGDIDNFDKKEGLPEVSFSERTATASLSGSLLFGTHHGFYSISPDRLRREESHPDICLTELQLNNTIVEPGDPGSPLDRALNYADGIRLKARQSNFSIAFSLLSFRSTESNHYAYILEGFDEKWNYVGTEHKATFTNVPPGSYVFRVKGLDSDLSEYGTETSLEVTILPPPWRTGLAFAAYGVVLLGLFFLVYRISTRFVRLKNNLRVEKLVAESKLRFFTNISHEIRTPLTLILGPVDKLVGQTSLGPEIRHQMAVIHRNTKRLLRMVNMILDFRKIQHEKINLRIQEIELVPFLHQIFESFEAQAEQKNIRFNLVYDHEDESLKVWGDIQKLDIVIFNLLSNAFKFTPEKKSISIVVSREPLPHDSIQILVRDTGAGIAREKLDRIFDRFFVSHMDGANETQGTGIGLSLVREYIKLHEGEISVDSTPGKGTEFRVRLRTGRSHFPEDVVIKEREAYSYSPEVEPVPDELLPGDGEGTDQGFEIREKPHVLVVEDDVEMCFYLQKILENTYRVDVAKDGVEGMEKARKLNPDLVVTDVMMPRMNGIRLVERLKEEFTTCHIPVIMLSSKSAVESQVEGLNSGAEAYVPKPFNSEVLLSYIQSLLTQRRKIRSILESKVELKPDEVKVSPKDKEFIEKVIRLINENLANPEFNVEKLAAMVYISRTLFYKKIKGITGYQPVELIRMMRLKKAAKYIETGEFTVSEVAYMVGYNDIRYFSTSFKKQYGISPSQYQLG
jgi:signal transduction histidine kinase/ligand-binding sensor domain-containing protein/DNA-binding response OmpR family regulator